MSCIKPTIPNEKPQTDFLDRRTGFCSSLVSDLSPIFSLRGLCFRELLPQMEIPFTDLSHFEWDVQASCDSHYSLLPPFAHSSFAPLGKLGHGFRLWFSRVALGWTRNQCHHVPEIAKGTKPQRNFLADEHLQGIPKPLGLAPFSLHVVTENLAGPTFLARFSRSFLAWTPTSRKTSPLQPLFLLPFPINHLLAPCSITAFHYLLVLFLSDREIVYLDGRCIRVNQSLAALANCKSRMRKRAGYTCNRYGATIFCYRYSPECLADHALPRKAWRSFSIGATRLMYRQRGRSKGLKWLCSSSFLR